MSEPLDRIDTGLDTLLTSWLALQADGWLDEGAIDAVTASLWRGIADVRTARSLLIEAQQQPVQSGRRRAA